MEYNYKMDTITVQLTTGVQLSYKVESGPEKDALYLSGLSG